MFIAIDIGNSNITIGFKSNNKWTEYRFSTHSEQPLLLLREYVKGLNISNIRGIGLSSVVPKVTPIIRSELELLFGIKPITVYKGDYHLLPIKPKNPDELGTDLLVNSLAANKLFGFTESLIIDFGTALTYTFIDAKGGVGGVAIAPGINTALRALTEHAAQLPEITPTLPSTVLGNDTVSAIKGGTIWGFVGQVSFMIEKIKQETTPNLKIIATGGLSHVLEPLNPLFNHIDRQLTLNGIEIYFDIVTEANNSNATK